MYTLRLKVMYNQQHFRFHRKNARTLLLSITIHLLLDTPHSHDLYYLCSILPKVLSCNKFNIITQFTIRRSHWPRILRPLSCWDCGFKSRMRAWRFVSCECYVFSCRSLHVGLIASPQESYRE
jgi:hypothetical protein